MSTSTKKDKFIEKIIINLEKVNVKDWEILHVARNRTYEFVY